MSNQPSDEGWEELSEARDRAIRLTGRFIGRSINRAAALVRDTRKAFRQGLDPNVDDAVVLEETDGTERRRRVSTDDADGSEGSS